MDPNWGMNKLVAGKFWMEVDVVGAGHDSKCKKKSLQEQFILIEIFSMRDSSMFKLAGT